MVMVSSSLRRWISGKDSRFQIASFLVGVGFVIKVSRFPAMFHGFRQVSWSRSLLPSCLIIKFRVSGWRKFQDSVCLRGQANHRAKQSLDRPLCSRESPAMSSPTPTRFLTKKPNRVEHVFIVSKKVNDSSSWSMVSCAWWILSTFANLSPTVTHGTFYEVGSLMKDFNGCLPKASFKLKEACFYLSRSSVRNSAYAKWNLERKRKKQFTYCREGMIDGEQSPDKSRSRRQELRLLQRRESHFCFFDGSWIICSWNSKPVPSSSLQSLAWTDETYTSAFYTSPPKFVERKWVALWEKRRWRYLISKVGF